MKLDFDSPSESEVAKDKDFWAIYKSSFPPNEMEPAEVILRSLRKGSGMTFRARSRGKTLGIATTHLLQSPAAVFLVYLAIDEAHRSSGCGGALFDYTWTCSAARLRAHGREAIGMIWEVDPDDSDQSRRRIAFFERHGGVILERRYLQPPVNGPDAVPMRLMFLPRPGGVVPERATMDALVRGIYFEKYYGVNRISKEALTRLIG